MRKRKIIAIGISLLLLVLFFLWTTTTDFLVRKDILVNASLPDVAPQITNLENWKTWYPPLKDAGPVTVEQPSHAGKRISALQLADGRLLSLTVLNPVAVLLNEKYKDKESLQGLSATAESNGAFTRISWTKEVSFGNWLAAKFSRSSVMEEGLQQLKAKMEDPAQLYGFEMQLKPVTDTLILTLSRHVASKELSMAEDSLRLRLIRFINTHRINRAGLFYFRSEARILDSIQVSIGMPVQNRVASPSNEIEFLKLPATGRLLSGNCTVDQLPRLYAAMDQYLKDKGLKKAAMLYEKYGDEMVTEADPAKKKVELVYPVY